MQAFIFFFISSLFFFSGFKKKRKIYFGGREGEGESHKAKMFINFLIKKVYYLKNLKTRPLHRKILVTRILDWVLVLVGRGGGFLSFLDPWVGIPLIFGDG